MDASFDQPELVWSKLNQKSSDGMKRDESYLPLAMRRVLRGEGKDAKWLYTLDPSDNEYTVYYSSPPGRNTLPTKPDIFARQEFQQGECLRLAIGKHTSNNGTGTTTVQIVEFKRDSKHPPMWYPPLTEVPEISSVLSAKPSDPEVWRWIHCTGLNGATMKAIAKATGNLRCSKLLVTI